MKSTTLVTAALIIGLPIAAATLMNNGHDLEPTKFVEYVDNNVQNNEPTNVPQTPTPTPTETPNVERSYDPERIQPATTGGPLPGSPDAGGNTGGGYVSPRPTIVG